MATKTVLFNTSEIWTSFRVDINWSLLGYIDGHKNRDKLKAEKSSCTYLLSSINVYVLTTIQLIKK